MNCSTTSELENRSFLSGNFGALVFMVTYIGLYGMGLIVYFACQFMTDSRDHQENEMPAHFFSTLRQINERQNVYNQLIDQNWVKEIYQIYYSDQPSQSNLIEEKVNQCLQKYQTKIQNLQSRHAYYVTETSIPSSPPLTSIAYID